MNIFQSVRLYRRLGYLPFPLVPKSKEPYAGISLYHADRIKFSPDSNIGLFTGSQNGLVVLDADDDATVQRVRDKLLSLGLLDWTTIVITPRRKGRHFWLRIIDIPKHAQIYYRLLPQVGKGELRVRRPAYVVAPFSELEEGTYAFEQGGIEFFDIQPPMHWAKLTWLLPPHAFQNNGAVLRDRVRKNPLQLKYHPRPKVLALFPLLRDAKKGESIKRVNGGGGGGDYTSRSEAEQALILELIAAGWSFEQIEERFEEEQPGHYSGTTYPARYLISTYNKALGYFIEHKNGKKPL